MTGHATTWDSVLHVILNRFEEMVVNRAIKMAGCGVLLLWAVAVPADRIEATAEQADERAVVAASTQPPESAPPPKADPDDFVPSEEISADSGVSFPVDI